MHDCFGDFFNSNESYRSDPVHFVDREDWRTNISWPRSRNIWNKIDFFRLNIVQILFRNSKLLIRTYKTRNRGLKFERPRSKIPDWRFKLAAWTSIAILNHCPTITFSVLYLLQIKKKILFFAWKKKRSVS